MNAPGHLAVAFLYGRARTSGGASSVWLGVGALLPDVVDKAIYYSGLSPYGRTLGHSVIVLTLLWILARALPAAGAVVAGMALHMATDLIDDAADAFQGAETVFSAWAGWPLLTPDQLHVRVEPVLDLAGGMTLLEVGVLALAAARCWQLARVYGAAGRPAPVSSVAESDW